MNLNAAAWTRLLWCLLDSMELDCGRKHWMLFVIVWCLGLMVEICEMRNALLNGTNVKCMCGREKGICGVYFNWMHMQTHTLVLRAGQTSSFCCWLGVRHLLITFMSAKWQRASMIVSCQWLCALKVRHSRQANGVCWKAV